MILFVRDIGEKQYHRPTHCGDDPSTTPRKGWRKGMKYTTYGGRVFIVDSVDVEKKHGELRLHVTRIK